MELESVSEISSPRWSSVYECQSVGCAFTSPRALRANILVACKVTPAIWLNSSDSRNILIIHFGLLLKERILDSIGHDLWKKLCSMYLYICLCFLCIVICMHSFIQHVYLKYAIV